MPVLTGAELRARATSAFVLDLMSRSAPTGAAAEPDRLARVIRVTTMGELTFAGAR